MKIFWPRHQFPIQKGTDTFPNVIDMPMQVHTTVDTPPGWVGDPDAAASQVIDYYSTEISRFVQSQQQQDGLSTKTHHKAQMSVPGLDVGYTNNHGLKTLDYMVRPTQAPPEVRYIPARREIEVEIPGLPPVEVFLPPPADINFDGYIAVRKWGGVPGFMMRFRFFVNGVQLGPTYFSASQANEMILFTFGPTAMRCHSLSDKKNSNIPLLHPIIPPRFSIAAALNPDGFMIPKHDDLPGYFVYDWWNPVNYSIHYPSEDPLSFPTSNDFVTNPPIVLQFNFPSTKSTAFDLKGMNNCYLEIEPQLGPDQTGALITAIYDVFAEFFDRSSNRSVMQSWQLGPDEQSDIVVNDKSLWWNLQYSILGYTITGWKLPFVFDLSMTIKQQTTAMENLLAIEAIANASQNYQPPLLNFPLPPWPKGTHPPPASLIVIPGRVLEGNPPPINPPQIRTLEEATAAVEAMFITTSAYAAGYRLVVTPMSAVPSSNAEVYYVYDQNHVFWVPAG